MSVKRNHGGFRLDDCRALFAIHNAVMHEVSALSPGNEVAILRRLRVLGFWIASMGDAAFESDPEAEALAALDADMERFFAERKAGHDRRSDPQS